MIGVVLQVVCSLLIIAALVVFLKKNPRSKNGASKGQFFLAGFQVVLCGCFFALCLSDVLDIAVNFNHVRVILDLFYAAAFFMLGIYVIFTKHNKNDKDLKAVIISFIALTGMQCFVFPYETEYEALRIFESLEGAIVFGLLIVVLVELHDIKFCRWSLLIATCLELIVAIENTILPFAQITDDFQLIDIPLNYSALYMRPILFASLALTYRVWADGNSQNPGK
ncbi:MAG: hypothetical protein IJU25_07265 [Lachnospiraceae bacterium]|nr:hypothetical protein [Lachnospiraceae bacterium]